MSFYFEAIRTPQRKKTRMNFGVCPWIFILEQWNTIHHAHIPYVYKICDMLNVWDCPGIPTYMVNIFTHKKIGNYTSILQLNRQLNPLKMTQQQNKSKNNVENEAIRICIRRGTTSNQSNLIWM